MAKKNLFLKYFLQFFSGAFVAQFLGLLISPIISRIYTPQDFAFFTLYLQILHPLTILSSLSLFILIPKHKDSNLNPIIFQISILFSVFFSILISIEGSFRVYNFDFEIFYILWPFLAFSIVFTNFRAFYHFLCLSEKKFPLYTKSKISEGLSGSVGNIGFGLLGFNYLGLIYGNILGQLFFMNFILKTYFKEIKFILTFKKASNYFNLILKQRKHITFQTINHVLEYALLLTFSILITKNSSSLIFGYFAFFLKIFITPLNLIADYYSQTTLNRVSDFKKNEDIILFLNKSSILIVVPSFLLIITFYLWGPEIFSFIFGKKWEISGIIAKQYTLAAVSTFYIKSLQYLPNLKNKQDLYTIFSFLTYGVPVLIILFAINNEIKFIEIFQYISWILFILAILYYITLYRIFKSD